MLKTRERVRLYHRVPKCFTGDTLYPLNQLKQVLPELAEAAIQKYADRPGILKRTLPGSEHLWNDVLHLSPVHPAKIMQALRQAGLRSEAPTDWFELDPVALGFNSENSTIFLCHKERFTGWTLEASEFEAYAHNRIELYNRVPAATQAYYAESFAEGRQPVVFHRIPHIFHFQALPVESFKILSIVV